MLAVSESKISVTSYSDLLNTMLAWYRPLEPRLTSALGDWAPTDFQNRGKIEWLRSDLTALGQPMDALADAKDLPDMPDRATALGVAYVLEGATLGGAILSNRVRAHLGPDAPCRFFTAYGTFRGVMWRSFQTGLNARLDNPGAVERAVAGAAAAFLSLGDWLDTAPARATGGAA